MENRVVVQKEVEPTNFFQPNFKKEKSSKFPNLIPFTKQCSRCKGTGQKIKVEELKQVTHKCTSCVEGFIKVKCNNCTVGIRSDGKPCKTCNRDGQGEYKGFYIYRKTVKYPEGLKCSYCKDGIIIKNLVSKTSLIPCKACKGIGNLKTLFNPVIKQDEELIDKMLNNLFKSA